MEEAGNEWTCPKCKEKDEKEITDKQNAELKSKLKEREEDKKAENIKSAKTPVKARSKKLTKSGSKENLEKSTVEKKVDNFCDLLFCDIMFEIHDIGLLLLENRVKNI